jgi:hypothetical protein
MSIIDQNLRHIPGGAPDGSHPETWLYDFSKSQIITPRQYYCVSGKVNSADKLYLVMESVKPDTKHLPPSNVPVPADGAGGSHLR